MCNRYLVVAAISVFLLLSVPLASAQGKRNLIVDEGAARPVAPSGPRIIRQAAIVRTVYQPPKILKEKVKVAYLIVTTEPGAKVALESVGKAKPYKKAITAGPDGSAFFDDLASGNYKVEAAKDGFEPVKNDKVTIVAQKGQGVSLDLKAFTYTLRINTNLTGGDIRFAEAIYKGKDATGSIISEQLGNYCVVTIKPNGEAVIPDLKEAYYDIDIRPASLEYEQRLTGIDLTKGVDQGDGSNDVRTFQVALDKKISTETFGTTAWITADWMMPASWRLDKGMKVRNAEGIALPRNERYRYYRTFEMIANVKLKDDGTVGFVLRAVDDNYYLLQISGEKAENRNTAALYSVKKGQLQSINSATIGHFAKTMSSDNGFRVYIRNEKEEEFEVFIEDVDTGKKNPVGRFIDPSHTYKKGAVGIAALAKSNFEVNFFEVCTPTCSK